MYCPQPFDNIFIYGERGYAEAIRLIYGCTNRGVLTPRHSTALKANVHIGAPTAYAFGIFVAHENGTPRSGVPF